MLKRSEPMLFFSCSCLENYTGDNKLVHSLSKKNSNESDFTSEVIKCLTCINVSSLSDESLTLLATTVSMLERNSLTWELINNFDDRIESPIKDKIWKVYLVILSKRKPIVVHYRQYDKIVQRLNSFKFGAEVDECEYDIICDFISENNVSGIDAPIVCEILETFDRINTNTKWPLIFKHLHNVDTKILEYLPVPEKVHLAMLLDIYLQLNEDSTDRTYIHFLRIIRKFEFLSLYVELLTIPPDYLHVVVRKLYSTCLTSSNVPRISTAFELLNLIYVFSQEGVKPFSIKRTEQIQKMLKADAQSLGSFNFFCSRII